MKKFSFVTLVFVIAAVLAIPVMAGEGKGAKKEKKAEKVDAFKKADANADGKLSLEEFKTMSTKGDAEAKFKAADADTDGFVTPEELKAAKGKKVAKEKKSADKAAEQPAEGAAEAAK